MNKPVQGRKNYVGISLTDQYDNELLWGTEEDNNMFGTSKLKETLRKIQVHVGKFHNYTNDILSVMN